MVVSDKGGGAAGIEKQLERLNRTADRTRRVTERIGRRVRVGGIRRARQETEKLKKSAQGVGSVFAALGVSFGFAQAVRGIVNLSDEFTNFQNRLKIVTTDTQNLVQVTDELFAVADRTRSAFGATAELFTRVSLASKELGRSQRELLQFTESLNKAVILSGATAQEAKAGIIQLSQGLASGALRGDELRSVLEQLPKVADVLAKSLGVTRGELRRLGEEGKLTGQKIVKAVLDASASIDQDFAKTVPTISQAFTQLQNQLLKLVGIFNETTFAATGVALIIQFLSDNLPAVAGFLGAVAVGFAVVAAKALLATAAMKVFIAAAPGLAIFGVAVAAVSKAWVDLQEDIKATNAALAIAQERSATLTPYAELGENLITLRKELKQVERVFEEGGKTSQVAAQRIDFLKVRIGLLEQQIKEASDEYKRNTKEQVAFRKANDAVQESTEKALNLAKLYTRERKLETDTEKEFQKVLKVTNDLTEDQQKVIRNRIRALQEEIQETRDRTAVLEAIKGPQEEFNRKQAIANQLLEEGKIERDEYLKFLESLKSAEIQPPELPEDLFKAGAASLAEALKRIRDEVKQTGASGDVLREKLVQTLVDGSAGADTLRERIARIKEAAKQAGVSTAVMGEAIDEVLGKTVDEAYRDSLDDLDFKLKRNLITQREYNAEVLQLKRNSEDAATTLGDGFKVAFDKIKAEANDLAAVGEQIVDTFATAAVDAITSFAETGKFEFKEFARALLADIAKIIIRLLVVKALSAVAGAAGGGLVSTGVQLGANAITANNATNQGRQDGGTVQPGRSFVVGENGPEVFTPGQTGTITPNPRDMAMPAPEVKVSVTNVSDPNEIPAALDNGDFDENIVNVIARNKEAVNAGLQ